jgi:drug/metabolite transporter (DMT)-like permease
LGISVGDTFFFAALNDLGAHALVVLSTLGEVLTIALAVLFLGERHNVSAWLGIACVVAGITIVLGSKLRGEKSASGWRGIAFGLMAVLCMSVSTVIAKEGLEGVSALQATFIRMVSGTLGMFVFGTATGQVGKWISPLRDIHLVSRLFLSVGFITFGGFWLSLVSIQYIDVSIANSLNTTDPIFVLLLAAIFFKEKITRPAAIGTAMTVAGIVALWHE